MRCKTTSGAGVAMARSWARRRKESDVRCLGTVVDKCQHKVVGEGKIGHRRECFHRRLIDIVHHLRERDICISKSTVYRILRKEKFTRKRASAKYCPKLPTREEATAYLSALRSEKQVISIDESSIYLESRVRAAVQQVTKSRRPPRSRRRSRRTRGRRRRRRRRWGRGRAFSRPRS